MFTNEFIALCQNYARKKSNVLDEKILDSRKLCVYTLTFFNYIIAFRYVKKESLYLKPSSLFCTVKLSKNSVVHYHLPDIIPHLDEKTYECCYFWNIESPERLEDCFCRLEAVLEQVLSQLKPFLQNSSFLESALFDSYKSFFGLDADTSMFDHTNEMDHPLNNAFLSLQRMRDDLLFSRYTSFAPYALLLKGKTEKALAQYRKLEEKGKLFEYEKLLIRSIGVRQRASATAMVPGFDTSAETKLVSPLSLLNAVLLCYIISSLVVCGACGLYNWIASRDTVAFFGMPWYGGFLFAGLCAIFGGIAFLPYVPNRHFTKTQRRNYANIFISRGLRIFSFVIFGISVAATVFMLVMSLTGNVRFYDDRICFDGKTYVYEQIDSVYYVDARYNVYGERIERGSYVILFTDKTSLDLDCAATPAETENTLVPLLDKKGFDVSFADSVRDLPWYSEDIS